MFSKFQRPNLYSTALTLPQMMIDSGLLGNLAWKKSIFFIKLIASYGSKPDRKRSSIFWANNQPELITKIVGSLFGESTVWRQE